MNAKAQRQPEALSQELSGRIRDFVSRCREPVVIETGEKPIALVEGRYAIEPHGHGCILHVWGQEGNIVRRIIALERERKDRLELLAKAFGRGEVKISLVDRARRGDRLNREAGQVRFRESLRRMLGRVNTNLQKLLYSDVWRSPSSNTAASSRSCRASAAM